LQKQKENEMTRMECYKKFASELGCSAVAITPDTDYPVVVFKSNSDNQIRYIVNPRAAWHSELSASKLLGKDRWDSQYLYEFKGSIAPQEKVDDNFIDEMLALLSVTWGQQWSVQSVPEENNFTSFIVHPVSYREYKGSPIRLEQRLVFFCRQYLARMLYEIVASRKNENENG